MYWKLCCLRKSVAQVDAMYSVGICQPFFTGLELPKIPASDNANTANPLRKL
jgi:hypothetical protein